MGSGSAQISSAAILLYGSDDVLLGTRTMVLENAGFRVVSSINRAEAEAILESRDIALVVFCHSLYSEDCEAVIQFAGSRNPPVKTLVLTAGDSRCAEHPAAVIISTFDGPRRLVETVQLLLG